MNSRRWIFWGAALAGLAVAIGAFGAHGLEENLRRLGFDDGEIARRAEIFHTAARYQMVNAIALILAGLLAAQGRGLGRLRAAVWALAVGTILFCGLLYALVFADPRWNWLGAVVPVGGLAMIAGWVLIAASQCGTPSEERG